MQTLIIDFETYVASNYSLRTMTPVLYIRDKRFAVHGAAYKLDDGPIGWLRSENIPSFLSKLGPTRVIGHNLLFDALILRERYKFTPAEYFDTLGAARLLLPIDQYDLDYLGEHHYNLGGKSIDVVAFTRNKTIDMLTPKQRLTLIEYAIHDVRITEALFNDLYNRMPFDERDLLHTTIRWGVEGTLDVDTPLLDKTVIEDKKETTELIHKSGVTRKILTSNQQFAAHLEKIGATPPLKISPTTGQPIPAIGQNDIEYQRFMADHPELSDLFRARKKAKSNILTTRALTYYDIGKTGKMVMPLNYCGAHTGRWSGSGKLNVQNMPRKSNLRKAMIAPDGYVVVAGDLSQIELRVNAWFCGESIILDVAKINGDVYRTTAARVFNTPEEHITDEQRSFAKVMELALGYGMGAEKFRITCELGPMGAPPIHLSSDEALAYVNAYRQTHPNITQMWKRLGFGGFYHNNQYVHNGLLSQMIVYSTHDDSTTPPPITSIPRINAWRDAIELPSGRRLLYPNLHENPSHHGSVQYGVTHTKYIYGGLLLENLIQAIARDILAHQILEIERNSLYLTTVSTTHDEIIAIAPEDHAQEASDEMSHFMTLKPKWALDLPVHCEVKTEKYYAK